MNLNTAIFLFKDSGVRSVRVEYDPDTPMKAGYVQTHLFKTLDPNIKKDDLVIVPTDTRYKFTVAKVIEADFPVDFDAPGKWAWIGGNFDVEAYKAILAKEETVLSRIRTAEETRKRRELAETMRLSDIDVSDIDLLNGHATLPASPTPAGAAPAATPQTETPVT
jgi:hypothetical protein